MLKYIKEILTPEDLYNIAVKDGASLDKLKELKTALLSTACNQAIVAGFYSSALGEDHLYPYDDEAQRNIQGAVLEFLVDPSLVTTDFKTLDAGYLPHTAEQMKKVGLDAAKHLKTQLYKNQQLKAQVQAIQDSPTAADEVLAITW